MRVLHTPRRDTFVVEFTRDEFDNLLVFLDVARVELEHRSDEGLLTEFNEIEPVLYDAFINGGSSTWAKRTQRSCRKR